MFKVNYTGVEFKLFCVLASRTSGLKTLLVRLQIYWSCKNDINLTNTNINDRCLILFWCFCLHKLDSNKGIVFIVILIKASTQWFSIIHDLFPMIFWYLRILNFFSGGLTPSKNFHILYCCEGRSPEILINLIICNTPQYRVFDFTGKLFCKQTEIVIESVIFINKFLLVRRTTSWQNLLVRRKFY